MEIVSKKLSYIYLAGTPFAQPALHNVSIRVPANTFAAMIGPTGSGKSTLIQLIAGLLTPTSGMLQIGEHQVTNKSKKLSALRRKVGLVFQYPEYQLFAETVGKDIAFGPTNQGLSATEIDTRVKSAIKLVGLSTELMEKPPFSLSGGQMRKVAIAGVLAMEPSILILDEPTVGLDPQSRREFLQLVASIQENRQITVLMITHQMDDVAAYAKCIYLMDQGQLISAGTRAKILTNESLLTSLKLDLPEIVKLVHQLNQGLAHPLPADIFSLTQLVTALEYKRNQGKS